MMHPRRRRWSLVTVAGLAMALVACGDEGPPTADEPSTDETEGLDPADDDPETDDPADDPADDSADDTAPEDDPMDDPAPGDDAPPTNGDPMGDPDGPPDVVTEDHDGETIALPQDGAVRLQLSSDWFWDEPHVDGTSIELVRVDYLVDPGFQEWEVHVAAPGVANVTASGEPNCADPDDCPPRTVELRFEVVG